MLSCPLTFFSLSLALELNQWRYEVVEIIVELVKKFFIKLKIAVNDNMKIFDK